MCAYFLYYIVLLSQTTEISNYLQATTRNNLNLNDDMNDQSIEKRQAEKDAEYIDEYKKWFAALDAATKETMKTQGLHQPDAKRGVSKGSFDNELLDNQKAPTLGAFEELEIIPEGVDEKAEQIAMRACRVALSNICNPRPGNSVEYEAAIIALSIGVMGMVSISHQAAEHGVSRQAVSKRCRIYCDESGIRPSVYMRSEANREIHRLANVRGKALSHG